MNFNEYVEIINEIENILKKYIDNNEIKISLFNEISMFIYEKEQLCYNGLMPKIKFKIGGD